jgi:hypothetical protein
MSVDLETIVSDFASALVRVDARRPQAVNARSKRLFKPGIGPHTESATVDLVAKEMVARHPHGYGQGIRTVMGKASSQLDPIRK